MAITFYHLNYTNKPMSANQCQWETTQELKIYFVTNYVNLFWHLTQSLKISHISLFRFHLSLTLFFLTKRFVLFS